MDSTVEKVAEALRQIPFKMPGAGGLRGTLHLAPAQAREFAETAIAAMREPTEAQEVAFVNATLNRWATLEGLRDGYRAMIDAALAETPKGVTPRDGVSPKPADQP